MKDIGCHGRKALVSRTQLQVCLLALLLPLVLAACRKAAVANVDGPSQNLFTLSGTLFDSAGTPAIGARVSLRPSAYLQGEASPEMVTARDTLTDGIGVFRIAGLPAGIYAWEFNQGDTLGLFGNIALPLQGAYQLDGMLQPLSKVRGYIVLPESGPRFYIQVYGLSRRFQINPNGSFSVPLAPGEYDLRLISESSLYRSLEIPHITIASDHDTLLAELLSDDLLVK